MTIRKSFLVTSIVVVLLVGVALFFALGVQRQLFRIFSLGQGPGFRAFGDANTFFSRIGATLGLGDGATKEQVLELLGLQSDAGPGQIMDALRQRGITIRITSGFDDSNSYFARLGESLGLPAGATKEQVLAALGLPQDATQKQIWGALRQKGLIPARGASPGGVQQEGFPWQ